MSDLPLDMNGREMLEKWVASVTQSVTEQGKVIADLYATLKLLTDRVLDVEQRQDTLWKALQGIMEQLNMHAKTIDGIEKYLSDKGVEDNERLKG